VVKAQQSLLIKNVFLKLSCVWKSMLPFKVNVDLQFVFQNHFKDFHSILYYSKTYFIIPMLQHMNMKTD
ncbi:hypothetical protein O181_075545, partial [Austropuccinia psidii MF-1]|nr:hypothetical protein [Austropuccinia psidii MF-1]